MAIVLLQLPDFERKSKIRRKKCLHYRGNTFQHWGQVPKPVRDNRYRRVQVYRYRCCRCKHTFRHYSPGGGPGRSNPALAQADSCVVGIGFEFAGRRGGAVRLGLDLIVSSEQLLELIKSEQGAVGLTAPCSLRSLPSTTGDAPRAESSAAFGFIKPGCRIALIYQCALKA